MERADATDGYDVARALAVVAVGLGAGLRATELCALDEKGLADDAMNCYVDIRRGNGVKDRQIPIGQDVYELVAAYLTETGRAVHRTADREDAAPAQPQAHQRARTAHYPPGAAHRRGLRPSRRRQPA
jgi:site-specific recombinase XerC